MLAFQKELVFSFLSCALLVIAFIYFILFATKTNCINKNLLVLGSIFMKNSIFISFCVHYYSCL
eukprot:m.91624 g.91624  ORF g.91624 m.91624 type:complete len:64 (+) comp8877_c0_seq3:1609-1800(+)